MPPRDPYLVFASAATATAGLFAGGALYISAVQHPALTRCATSSGFRLAFFGSMFRLAAPFQASLAALSGAAAVTTGLILRERRVLIGKDSWSRQATLWAATGVGMLSIVPYTLVCMMKLNRQLMDTERALQRGDAWVTTSLQHWGRLHAVRTAVSVVAFGGMVFALSRGPRQGHAIKRRV